MPFDSSTGTRAPGMPDERRLADILAQTQRTFSDRDVIRRLASGEVRDAMNGNVLPRHVYRLDCGHLEQVHGAPLPRSTRRLFCAKPQCRREVSVVEWLTEDLYR